MRSRGLAVFSILGLAALPALAQEEGIHWHDNYKAALDEARSTGKPIFLEYRCEP